MQTVQWQLYCTHHCKKKMWLKIAAGRTFRDKDTLHQSCIPVDILVTGMLFIILICSAVLLHLPAKKKHFQFSRSDTNLQFPIFVHLCHPCRCFQTDIHQSTSTCTGTSNIRKCGKVLLKSAFCQEISDLMSLRKSLMLMASQTEYTHTHTQPTPQPPLMRH